MNQIYFNRLEAVSVAATAAESQVPEQSATDALVLSVCAFNNENDNVPQQVERTWAELCKRLSTNQLRNSKPGTPTWSPTRYKPGATRGNDGVESISCAVFDIEHHGPFETLKDKLSGYAYLAHSSFRNTPEDPRYRVILPLITPSLAEHWPTHWERINQWLGGINDPQTSDESRIYFIPCHPPGGVHFLEIGKGKALDINELPELPEGFVVPTRTVASKGNNKVKFDWFEEVVPDLSPAQGLGEMVSRCVFMQVVSMPENQNTVSEPMWSAMIANAGCFLDSEAWIHEASCHYDGYDETATDKRIERFRNNYAPVTCQRIQSMGFKQCPEGGCKLPRGAVTKSPAGLWTWWLQRPVVLPFEQLD